MQLDTFPMGILTILCSAENPTFSLVSAFSQKNKTYKMGLRARVCVCVQFWSPPNNFHTSYAIDTKFWLHVDRTGTLQGR